MTLIVGILCTDGVVVGTDSAMTFVHGNSPTIEQPLQRKIDIIRGEVILAGTGEIGLNQRFANVVKNLWKNGAFRNQPTITIGKALTASGLQDFAETGLRPGIFTYGALVALPRVRKGELIEFGVGDLQPEIKSRDNWYVSMGSGQSVVDPLLGFMRKVFWGNQPPSNARSSIYGDHGTRTRM